MQGAWRSWRPSRLVNETTSLAALVSAVVVLGFTLWPSAKPDPGIERGADLEVLEVERYVTVAEWLRRLSSSQADFEARRREYEKDDHATNVTGVLAYVHVSARGFKRSELKIRWSVYKHPAREPLTRRIWNEVADTKIEAETPLDDIVLEQWIAAVSGPKRYFIRFEVRNGDGALLDVADSKPFPGLLPR
jgi:hypothetical protein